MSQMAPPVKDAVLATPLAGFIAVPLPAPQFGNYDERVSSALRDSMPAVLLTTSSVIDEVARYARHVRAAPRERAPIVVAVDSLDLDAPREFDATRYAHPSTAYLQYTSGRCSPRGELRVCGSSGDRVAILAPQGLHWSTREPGCCCCLAQKRHRQLRTDDVRLLRGSRRGFGNFCVVAAVLP